MNDQYFGKQHDPSDIVEGTYKDTTSPDVNSDVFTDKVPVDATPIHETQMEGTVASVSPLYEPVREKTPMFETPLQATPMGGTNAAVGPMNWPQSDKTPVYETPVEVIETEGTVAAVGLMDETIVHEAPVSDTIPYQAPVSETIANEAPIVTSATPPATLLNHEESEHFRSRWNEIQGKFVDEPRSAVQQADVLVSEVVEQITQMFAKEHSSLEGQWKQGEEVSTEDLRKALQHYRSFFNRLVV